MNTVKNYKILRPCGCDDSALIDKFSDGELDKRDFNRGNLLSSKVHQKIILKFSNDAPDRIKLYDFVNNTLSFLIISDRVKNVLESENTDGIEYIPAHIFDHQGNIAGENYYIINFIKAQPIIDMEKSQYTESFFDDNQIDEIELLHLNLEKVDPEAKLFRATTEEFTNFITDDLLHALEKANITGIKTIPAEGWDGNTLSFI